MKSLAIVVALFFAHSAFAIPYICESEDKAVNLTIDLEAHFADEESNDIMVHTYIDSINYGAGNFLKESAASEILATGDNWTQFFRPGISLKYLTDRQGCDMRMEFSHAGQVRKTGLCCSAQ